MQFEINKNISAIFNGMSAMYKYLGGDNRFRALAYGKAAKVIDSLMDDIKVYAANNILEELPGIGEGIADKIEEYIKTGTIKKYEELKKIVPLELMGMLDIAGFGPQSLKRIHDELKINTKGNLINALHNGSIAKIKGFGQKKVNNMLRGLKLHKTIEDRMLLWDAMEAGEKILNSLNKFPEVRQAAVAGSLRRKKETIGDIDILIACDDKHRSKLVNYISRADFVKQILAKGDTKVSILLKENSRQVDLRIVNQDEWGSALLYFTGSKEHNIHLRTIAKEKEYKISEYGIFKIENGEKLTGNTEEEIYNTLGFQFIPPEMREDHGEIELASKNKIPKLISIKDIKGDLQMHSNWSDGINSIEEIANHIRKNFSYQYIVLTDHSKSSRIANGMDEKQILEQVKAIELVNKNIGRSFVKSGLEVDILEDGTLDISDEILSQLDWVTASIHSNFKGDNTERIVKACQNQYMCCIGHPTGRLIGTREPYIIDMEKIALAAQKTNTALEINAQPTRMDLNEDLVKIARKKGVKFVISSDSHSLSNFEFMPLGVDVARRAWCTANDILNTTRWEEVKQFKEQKLKVTHY